jgi:dipeptidyl aminopeptidase/acylaminoacyl peptidase
MTGHDVIRYGTLPSQFAETHAPTDAEARGVAVMLHGGWWRARHGLRLMDGLGADLGSHSWLVVNVEYRRTGGDGGGWPQTLEDVFACIDAARAKYPDCAPLPTVLIGHSAGGHLALLASAHRAVSAVVALAPITDLARCARAHLGEDATAPFIGAQPDEAPDEYRRASPLYRLPLGRPNLVIHGDRDDRVPVEHSRDYVAAARAAGDPVDYVEMTGTDHFQVIDPTHESWSHVRFWLDGTVL